MELSLLDFSGKKQFFLFQEKQIPSLAQSVSIALLLRRFGFEFLSAVHVFELDGVALRASRSARRNEARCCDLTDVEGKNTKQQQKSIEQVRNNPI